MGPNLCNNGHVSILIISTNQNIFLILLILNNIIFNLAKLDDGLAESPTVMVVDKTKKNRKPCENRGIKKTSRAFAETKNWNLVHIPPCFCIFI
jgi:hypothetical protein